ncbi:hypothetical protein BB561_002483 [Smittium simulii]|uniref:Uncharacterized protein n=1 Tax=Smittium simulii TaxID=133385 RepID=A0A2T9YQG0_9FUNG|nr:hypothetical protein BB561_002483 [Smittium simulii]
MKSSYNFYTLPGKKHMFKGEPCMYYNAHFFESAKISICGNFYALAEALSRDYCLHKTILGYASLKDMWGLKCLNNCFKYKNLPNNEHRNFIINDLTKNFHKKYENNG